MHHLKNSNTLESHKISQNLTKSHKAEIGMNTTESELIDVFDRIAQVGCMSHGRCVCKTGMRFIRILSNLI